MARLQKLIRKIVYSVPHLSPAFEKRRHPRYKPTSDMSAEMKINGETIVCKVLDISMEGLKIATDDGRVKDARSVLLEAEDVRLAFPCLKVVGCGPFYGVEFDKLDETRIAKLNHIIDTHTDQSDELGPDEMPY